MASKFQYDLPLRQLAQNVRRHVLHMTSNGGSSHVGAAFSIVDILAVLYGCELTHDPKNPRWSDRDRFILSKGHAGAAVYATLAECGYFPTEELKKHYQDGSVFSGHVSHKGVPGVELSTGSLGHGLGVAVGMAKALSMTNSSARVIALLSDGECDEGSIWEAALFAQHHQLSNLSAIIDYNKIQSLALVAETIALEPLRNKWESFNWTVFEADGHSYTELSSAFTSARTNSRGPSVIIAHTTKGKGVSFMENSVLWHYRTARGEEFARALAEINNNG